MDEGSKFVTIAPDGGDATGPKSVIPDSELDALLDEVAAKPQKPKFSTVSSVGGQMQKLAQEKAQEQINQMQLSASAVSINKLSARELQLLIGEVEFRGLGTGGHRVKSLQRLSVQMKSCAGCLFAKMDGSSSLQVCDCLSMGGEESLRELGQFTNTSKPRGLGHGHWHRRGLAVQIEVLKGGVGSSSLDLFSDHSTGGCNPARLGSLDTSAGVPHLLWQWDYGVGGFVVSTTQCQSIVGVAQEPPFLVAEPFNGRAANALQQERTSSLRRGDG